VSTGNGSHPAGAARPSEILLFFGWLLCSIFFFYAFVLRVAPSVMVDELMRDFAVGGAVLGNLSAFYYYAYASMQIPVGVMMDRVGPRRLVAAAFAMVAAGSLVFASAETIWVGYLGRLMIGLGCAFSFVGALTYAALWFPVNRFATLGGWAQMLGVLGGIVGQAPLGLLIEVSDWRTAMAGLGALGLALAIAAALTLRDRRVSRPVENAGLLAGLKVCSRNPGTWIAALFGMAMTATMLAFAGLWGVPYMIIAHDLEKSTAALVVSLLFVGWGIGAPAWGVLSDWLGERRPLMIAGGLIATIGIALVIYLPGLPLWLVSAILIVQGFGSASMVLCFAVTRESNPEWASGVAIGIVNCFVVGSGAIMQPIVGWMLDLAWDGTLVEGARIYSVAAYETAFSILPITCGAGIIAAWLVGKTGSSGDNPGHA